MKTNVPSLAAALATIGIASVALHASLTRAGDLPKASAEPAAESDEPRAEGTSGISGNLHFVDEHGNPRQPTAAEMRELAAALKKDLARIAGPHKGRAYERTEPSGAVAATVATSNLVFVTAIRKEDGTLAIGHSSGEDSTVSAKAVDHLPEM